MLESPTLHNGLGLNSILAETEARMTSSEGISPEDSISFVVHALGQKPMFCSEVCEQRAAMFQDICIQVSSVVMPLYFFVTTHPSEGRLENKTC